MREWEIGKIIKVKGELYEVCENDNPKGFSLCSDCALARGGCGTLGLVRCFSSTRSDKKNVIFKKITKDIKDKKMNENLDLVEILKDCPKGTEFFSNIFGTLFFENINYTDHTDSQYPIRFTDKIGNIWKFTKDGKYPTDRFEDCDMCVFPSKEQRDWGKFKVPVEKEVKYRPFKDAEECWNEMLKHKPFGWVYADLLNEFNGALMQITLINNKGYRFVTDRQDRSYSDAFEINSVYFADGTPFGIKEGE